MAELFLVALILISCSGLPALACGRWGRRGELASVILLLSGVSLALGASLTAVWQTSAPMLSLAWTHPAGHFNLELDGIAAIFLLPALVILGMGGIYGLGYFPQAKFGIAAGRLRFFYGVLG